MKRSKCVICGKVRYQNKLIKINNSWVCKYSKEIIQFNNVGYDISECKLNLIVNHYRKIDSKMKLLYNALNQTDIIKMELINIIIPPDLILLLKKIYEDK
jgi:hypothetical protein